MKCTLHFDGGSRGNPGPAASGIVLCEAATGTVRHEGGYFLGRMTSNMAEYRGLLRGLDMAEQAGATELTIRSDSELLVRQVLGQYRVKSTDLKPLFQEAIRRLGAFEHWSIEHVRRDHNHQADRLANRAMDAEADVVLSP